MRMKLQGMDSFKAIDHMCFVMLESVEHTHTHMHECIYNTCTHMYAHTNCTRTAGWMLVYIHTCMYFLGHQNTRYTVLTWP
jgi:hypothetical protein